MVFRRSKQNNGIGIHKESLPPPALKYMVTNMLPKPKAYFVVFIVSTEYCLVY